MLMLLLMRKWATLSYGHALRKAPPPLPCCNYLFVVAAVCCGCPRRLAVHVHVMREHSQYASTPASKQVNRGRASSTQDDCAPRRGPTSIGLRARQLLCRLRGPRLAALGMCMPSALPRLEGTEQDAVRRAHRPLRDGDALSLSDCTVSNWREFLGLHLARLQAGAADQCHRAIAIAA